jgi:hypothetical protein
LDLAIRASLLRQLRTTLYPSYGIHQQVALERTALARHGQLSTTHRWCWDEGKPTDTEESIARVGERAPELVTALAEAMPDFGKLPAEVRPVLIEAWVRYVRGFRSEKGFRMEQLGPLAHTL